MFSCFPMPVVQKDPVGLIIDDKAPVLIDGVSELNTLCPVNKLTGKRSNVLTLLNLVGDGKVNERVINTLLQDIPVIQNDSSLTDSQRFEFIQNRLSTGTPAEDALMSERLFYVADQLGIDTSDLSRDSDGKIVFEGSPSEVNNVEQETK